MVNPFLPAKEPLTGVRPIKPVKGMLANGRNKKSMPSIENWFAPILPIDTACPAWRALTKTATDVAIICKAKSGRAAKMNEKDKTGMPMFAFTVSEAETVFKLTRPTFTKAIHLLLKIGFIEQIRSGGMVNGNGIKALYRLSDKWKSWDPPPKDNANIFKARLARKQNPRKGALNGLGKGAFNGYD